MKDWEREASGQVSAQIAVETGYQTTSAFTKAIKRTFVCIVGDPKGKGYQLLRLGIIRDLEGIDAGACRFGL